MKRAVRIVLHILRLLLVIGLMSLAAINLAVALRGIEVQNNLINMTVWLMLVAVLVILDGGITKRLKI